MSSGGDSVKLGSPDEEAFDGSYRVLGYGFRIRTELASVARALDRALTQFRAPAGSGEATYSVGRRPPKGVYVAHGSSTFAETEEPAVAVDYVLWHINAEVIRRTDEFLMIHAGAVAWKGGALLMPARMNRGKTTLTAGLIRAGFTYLTDEAALIEPATGMVHPYPKALTLESGALEALRIDPPVLARGRGEPSTFRHHFLPGDLRRGAVAGSPQPVGYVIAPVYAPREPTSVVPISRAEAVHILAQRAFNLDLLGARGLSALVLALRSAQCYRMRVGDLDSAVGAVREVVRAG